LVIKKNNPLSLMPPFMQRCLRIVDEATAWRDRPKQLLCISCEDQLLVDWILALEGYVVEKAANREEAEAVISRVSVDLIIIGPTMNMEELSHLSFSLKTKTPNTFVLILRPGSVLQSAKR
jgi:DNA-binding NtrC family response regulator